MPAADLELSDGEEEEQERLVMMDDDDDDSDMLFDDSDISDSDEEVITSTGGKTQKRKRPPFGKWKKELAATKQDAIPEDKLHIVSWGRVALHTIQNAATIVLFIAFAAISHVPVVLSLPLFMVTFLLAVIVWEVLQHCRIQIQVGAGLLLIAVVAAGMIALGPLDFLPLFAQLLFIPLLLIVIGIRVFEKPWTTNLHGTSIWQALSGRKYGLLLTENDLAKLCKGIYHYKGQKYTRCFWDALKKAKIYDWSTVRVQMVQVDESNADVADTTLELYGVEVEPDKYLLTQLMKVDAEEKTEELPFEDLDGALKQRKSFSDKVLDTWLNPAWVDIDKETAAQQEAAGKTPKETRIDKVKKWVRKITFPPGGKDCIVARFRRYSYFEGLYEHWAPRAMKALLFCAVLSFPAVHILMDLDQGRRAVGKEAGSGDFEGKTICGSGEDLSPCSDAAKSLINWTGAINDVLHTSNVELFLPFVMLPVFIFNFSVEMAQQEHNHEELIYLRRLRTAKKGINEVMRMKNDLEDVLTFSFCFDRVWAALRAWRGADPMLAACGPITEAEFALTDMKPYNSCFKQVMEPIIEMKSGVRSEFSEDLSYGIGYDAEEEEDEETGGQEITTAWEMLKFENALGNESGRNYKVLFDLKIHTEDSWKVFKDWCKNKYKSQMKHITTSVGVEAQDSGRGTHITENVPIYDIVLPKGFSLTHVYVQKMPEDGNSFQIELSGCKTGDKEFWGLCDNLEHNIAKAIVDEEEDDEDFEGSTLDRRLADHPIVARFALSEQYYNNMTSADVAKLCGSETPAPSTFTDYVDRLLKPVKFTLPEEAPKIGGKEADNQLFLTGISVFMGDESPLRALLASLRACLLALRVWIECLGLAILVPAIRKMMGRDFFPAPLTFWLILNTIAIWVTLVIFFSDFHRARTRLSLISRCLSVLEGETMSPAEAVVQTLEESGEDETGGDDEEKEDEDVPAPVATTNVPAGEDQAVRAAQARAKKKKRETDEVGKPFDLVIEDSAKGGGGEYDPTSDFWVEQWRTKHMNVQNWLATVSHLRVFVSTSRLVAQTMLVAAAIIVGFLLLMSVLQMIGDHGAGAPGAAKDGVGGALDGAAAAGHSAARRLHEEVGYALQGLFEDRSAAQSSAGAAAHGEPLVGAARRLHAALQPAQAGLHAVLLQQHDTLVAGHSWLQDQLLARQGIPPVSSSAGGRRLDATSDSMKKVDELAAKLDVTKATKTQIFTVVMVLFVMFYSVPLMWNIVLVNGFFDRHDDLLVKQKERHRVNQAKREVRRKDNSGAGEDPEKDKEKDEAGALSGAATFKDAECKRYEKMLDMGIESSKKSRERFPLKLFGFVITGQLLATWVFLAASPIFSQAKQLAPGLAVRGCHYLEKSSLVNALQKQMDKTNPSMHLKVKQTIHENVCAPLRSALNVGAGLLPDQLTLAQKNKLANKVAAKAGPTAKKTRRLIAVGMDRDPLPWEGDVADRLELDVPDLHDIVRAWWQETPAQHPEAKFATAYAALQDLSRSGDRLLAALPAAVARTWKSHASHDLQAAFTAAMGATKPHLELAVEQDDDLVMEKDGRTYGRDLEL